MAINKIDTEILNEYIKKERDYYYSSILYFTYFSFLNYYANKFLNKKSFENEEIIITSLYGFIEESIIKKLKRINNYELLYFLENIFIDFLNALSIINNKNELFYFINELKNEIINKKIKKINKITNFINNIIKNYDYYFQLAFKYEFYHYITSYIDKKMILLIMYNLNINFENLKILKSILNLNIEEIKLIIFNFFIILKGILDEIYKKININKSALIKKFFEIKKHYFMAKKKIYLILNNYIKEINKITEKEKKQKNKKENKNKIDIKEEIKILKEYNYMNEIKYKLLENFLNNHLNKKELDIFENFGLYFIVNYIKYQYLKDNFYKNIAKEIELFEEAFKFLNENNAINHILKHKMLNNEFLKYYIMYFIFYARYFKNETKELNIFEILKMRELLRRNNFKIPYEHENNFYEYLKDIEEIFIKQFIYKPKLKLQIADIYKYNFITNKYYDYIKKIFEEIDEEKLKSKKIFKLIIDEINNTIKFLENNKNYEIKNDNIFIDNINLIFKKNINNKILTFLNLL